MNINGYVLLKSNIDCSKAMGSEDEWVGGIFRALEINESTNSVLLLNKESTGMGMFDMSDVNLFFHCDLHSGVIMPKGLNFLEKVSFASLRLGRKGGYCPIVKSMVIGHSLHKGEFYDDFLFLK